MSAMELEAIDNNLKFVSYTEVSALDMARLVVIPQCTCGCEGLVNLRIDKHPVPNLVPPVNLS